MTIPKSEILREVYDDNLESLIRLRMSDDGNVFFTSTKPMGVLSPATCLCRPLLVQIRVTKKCNLNCPYCYANDNSDTHDMSFEQLRSIVDICDHQGVLAITWTGGEPFSMDNFPTLIKETHSRGIRQTILSNGTLLHNFINVAIPQSNIDFQISLNNVWDHANIETTELSLKNAQAMLNKGYKVLVSVLLECESIERYEALIKKLICMGIARVKFGFKIPVGAAKKTSYAIYENTIKKLIPDLLVLKRKYDGIIQILYQFDKNNFAHSIFPKRFIMCEAGTTQIYIDNNGDVYPCPLLKSYPFMRCGNVLHNTWNDLWNSSPMDMLRNIHECGSCEYDCKVWCRAMKYAMDDTLQGKSNFCLKLY